MRKRTKASTTLVGKLTVDGEKMLLALMKKLGQTRISIAEIAIRKLAEAEKITQADMDQFPNA